MLYRIDMERFLTHAIDHFTRDELAHFQYAIISAGINNGGRTMNMSKIDALFPIDEIIRAFVEYKDKKILRKMYFEYLDQFQNKIYRTFINTILEHKDIVIICREIENDYIDILVEYLKENYAIECIDLNELFIKGRVGPIYIDRADIHNKAVDIRRVAGKEQMKALESSPDGRMKILEMMNKEEKIKKLKEYGIHVNKDDMKDLDKLLIEVWVEEE